MAPLLASLGLAWLGLSTWLTLRATGRLQLGAAALGGIGAALAAAVDPTAALLAGGLLGAGLGAATASLAPARFAALGLALHIGFASALPRIPGLGGHMGVRAAVPSLWALVVPSLLLLAALGVARSRVGRRFSDRLLLHRDADGLGAHLGLSSLGPRAALGALEGLSAAAGGVCLLASSGFLHANGFAFGASLDALTLGVLAHRMGTRAWMGLGLGAALWTGAESWLAAFPELRLVLLGLVLVLAGRRRGS